MRKQISQLLLLILWIAWMIMIFRFSATKAQQSAVESMRVGKLVCSVVVPGFAQWTAGRQYALAAAIDFYIRKSAHFLEYAVLGVLTLGCCRVWLENRKIWFLSWLWSILYAISDECHQLFVAGRAGRWQDVLLDAAGALSGIIIWKGIHNQIGKGRGIKH